MRHVKKGDEVIVLVGKDKGKVGKITQIITSTNSCKVAGANIHKKTVKANPNENQPGGFDEKEGPIHLSNVMRYNSRTKKGERTKVTNITKSTKTAKDKKNKKIRVLLSEFKQA